MSTKYKILCGTPDAHCKGSRYITTQSLPKKAHPSRVEAFRCYARYLIKVLGYTQIGSREFAKEGQPVRVLNKKSKFGALLRTGKEGSRYQPGGPGTKRGIIIG